MSLHAVTLLLALSWNLAIPLIAVAAQQPASPVQSIAAEQVGPPGQILSVSDAQDLLRVLEQLPRPIGYGRFPTRCTEREFTGLQSRRLREFVQLSFHPFGGCLHRIRAHLAADDRPA